MTNKAQSAKPGTSFADLVDYPTLYANLEKKGIHLSDEEKAKCEQIMGDRLRNHDGNSVLGNSFGAKLQQIAYMVFAFIQNLFTGSKADGFVAQTSNAMDTTSEQAKLHQLHLATAEAYPKLLREGGNLAKAAEFITYKKYAAEEGELQDMPGSVFNQVAATIRLPKNTNTNLNDGRPLAAAAEEPTSGLPASLASARASTQGLTARG